MEHRGTPRQETIGELFARLIDDGRSLINAELALFRLDFYQRIGRAKMGILLCLIGAIMGQATAVVLLISIAYALAPVLGGFGGAAVAAVVGGIIAVLLLRMGARQLMLIVDDEPSENKKSLVTMDQIFDRARVHSQEARSQLADAVGDAQNRLNPRTLLAQLWDEALDRGQKLAHDAVDTLARRPVRIGLIAFAAALVVIRPPVGHLLGRFSRDGRATGKRRDSLKRKSAGHPARPPFDEETTS